MPSKSYPIGEGLTWISEILEHCVVYDVALIAVAARLSDRVRVCISNPIWEGAVFISLDPFVHVFK
jgi:hypothetical protein